MKVQYNAVSGLEYQGGNQATLIDVKGTYGYSSDQWVTFLQAKDLGLKVKKGERGTHLATYGKDDITGNTWVKGFTVFNLDQTEQAKEVVTK